MSREMPALQGRAVLFASRVLVAAAVTAPFWFWKGGVLELEVLHFIDRYLDDRSLLHKIFDPYTNDFRTYQARELSYFIDYIDAHVFRQLLRWDLTVFIPLSAVVASALTVGIFLYATRRYRGLTPLTASLLLLVYLSNYIHLVTMGMFYRSTKPLLAPVLMGTAFYLASVIEGRARRWAPMAVFGLFCLMSLLDRQGFFYAIVGSGLVLAHALYTRKGWSIVSAAAAAVFAMTAYDLWIGPWIIERVSGYVPSLAYQEVPKEPLLQALPYRQSMEILGDSLTVFLGSTSKAVAIALVAAIVAAGIWRSGPGRAPKLTLTAIIAVVALSQVVMFAAMIVRHPPLYDWIDHRYWYYPLPFQALVLALLAMLLHRAIAGWTGWKLTVVHLAMAAAIAGNLAHWTFYRDVQLSSRWFSRVYPQTELLKSSLAAGQPDPRLIPQYRGFYELCQRVRSGQ
ncbi:MAG TPA: hypothetical protein VMS54_00735 [Vicinamibacterales bacterium]|nr:hypothetical protein [Vicinamibacterales bacterium]